MPANSQTGQERDDLGGSSPHEIVSRRRKIWPTEQLARTRFSGEASQATLQRTFILPSASGMTKPGPAGIIRIGARRFIASEAASAVEAFPALKVLEHRRPRPSKASRAQTPAHTIVLDRIGLMNQLEGL